MHRLNEEFAKTIIMVTHDPNAAQRAKRTLTMADGRLVSDTQNAPVREQTA